MTAYTDPRTGSDPARDNTTAEAILDAAEAQLLKLGTPKLRVVDVAAALGMSHANIYRYFKDRKALISALVRRWLAESEARALTAQSQVDAPDAALRALMVGMFTAKRARLSAGAGVMEIYGAAMVDHADAVDAHRQFLIGQASARLREGIEAGLFAIAPSAIPKALLQLETVCARFTDPNLVARGLDQDETPALDAAMTLYIEALKHAPSAFE